MNDNDRKFCIFFSSIKLISQSLLFGTTNKCSRLFDGFLFFNSSENLDLQLQTAIYKNVCVCEKLSDCGEHEYIP